MGEDSRERQGVCDDVAWRRAPLFNRFIVAISLTNLELLKLLPWTSDAYDGPSRDPSLLLLLCVTASPRLCSSLRIFSSPPLQGCPPPSCSS